LLETLGVVLTALAGLFIGRWASKRSSAARIVAMLVAFAVIGLILLARQGQLWSTFPMLCVVSASRIRFVLLAFAVTLGLTTPLSQLHSNISRFVTCLIMTAFIGVLISLPFIGPMVISRQLASTPNRIDVDGVCIQSRPFTCGPAAAVTALNHFGFEAAEGQLASDARTAPLIGTSPWNLYRALKSNYAGQGLDCSLEYFDSLDQMPAGAVMLAVVRDTAATDHCVAVMSMDAQTVSIADPMEGLVSMPRWRFIQQWRNCGIIMQRKTVAVSSL
jgi:predicted double-glycine peptidase